MAASQLIAVGTTAAQSADIVLADGASATVSLKNFQGHGARINIMLKDDAGGYHRRGQLTSLEPAVIIAGPGTFRLERPAGSAACGAFRG